MEQLAREGAAQAMTALETEEIEDPNETTALSDANSLQNFSYYGRRMMDRNFKVNDSPQASDAVSLTYGNAKNGHSQPAGAQLKKVAPGLASNSWTDCNSEIVSNMTG